jgi:transcriptional regulator with XRE-family HTH domain
MSKNFVGGKIRDFREFRRISREELALKTNLDQKQLEKIEEKGFMPSLGHLIKIFLPAMKVQESTLTFFRWHKIRQEGIWNLLL